MTALRYFWFWQTHMSWSCTFFPAPKVSQLVFWWRKCHVVISVVTHCQIGHTHSHGGYNGVGVALQGKWRRRVHGVQMCFFGARDKNPFLCRLKLYYYVIYIIIFLVFINLIYFFSVVNCLKPFFFSKFIFWHQYSETEIFRAPCVFLPNVSFFNSFIWLWSFFLKFLESDFFSYVHLWYPFSVFLSFTLFFIWC